MNLTAYHGVIKSLSRYGYFYLSIKGFSSIISSMASAKASTRISMILSVTVTAAPVALPGLLAFVVTGMDTIGAVVCLVTLCAGFSLGLIL